MTITLGGLSVIVAVLGMLVFLVVVVRPLFAGAVMTAAVSYPLLPAERTAEILFCEVEEYRTRGMCALATGEVILFAARNGRMLDRRQAVPVQPAPTSFARAPAGGGVAFGFADGTVRLGRFDFQTEPGAGDDERTRSLLVLAEPVPVGAPGDAITLLDYRATQSGTRLAVMTASGGLLVSEVARRTNMLTGKETTDLSSTPLVVPEELRALGRPAYLRTNAQGNQVILAWKSGTAARYDLTDRANPLLVERPDLTAGTGAALGCLIFMQGDQSILSGDSLGETRAWFGVERWDGGLDGRSLVAARTLERHDASVEVIAVSSRDKSLITGAADGTVLLHHLTSGRTLARAKVDPPSAIVTAQIAPKGDGVFVVSADGMGTLWDLRNPHPETTLSTLFGPVWYEGYQGPAFTWQSSSGTDDFEPKLSLTPLIFGTFKATFYSMLFAVPIAVSAALYTSEFLDRRYRAALKSSVEMMASLPSVVLGFIAALVLAPLVEKWAVAVFVAFAIIPLGAILLGHLSGWLPRRLWAASGGGAPWLHLAALIALAILSAAVARALAPLLEEILFAGDFKAWLDGRTGSGASAIGLLSWPLILVSLMALDARRPAPPRDGSRPRLQGAARFLLIVGASIAAAGLIAAAGSWVGLDPRGALFGTYVQRNALVVGFVMGFAIIPIIYTVAEDALAAVPDSLRSASLGCGASRWQTALRIVLPVAVPGIFSALMIGLGRAAGETMIVLMAAGNTPVLDMNLFNGLRTLSANIAVELPEAVKDGTLYRVLFLAALMLFLITFVVNTIAEIVRQRFRRRSLSL